MVEVLASLLVGLCVAALATMRENVQALVLGFGTVAILVAVIITLGLIAVF